MHNSGRSVAALHLTRAYAGVRVDARSAVTMGCGESCTVFPGQRHEDWQVGDPKGQDLATVRRIVDDVDTRVRALLADLNVAVPAEPGRGTQRQAAPRR